MNEQVPSKEPFFVGYLRAYATYFRKPHEQREMGIRDSYLLSCAEEMERAADEIERLSAAHEPPAAPPEDDQAARRAIFHEWNYQKYRPEGYERWLEIQVLKLRRASQPPPAALPSAKRFIPGQCNCKYEATQPDPRACPMHGTSQLSKSASPVGDFLRALNDDAEAFADIRAAEGATSSTPGDVIRARSFWSPDHKDLITAYVSASDISLMDDNGDIYEPAGDEQLHGPSESQS